MGGSSSCPEVECDYTDYRLRSECPTTAEMQRCNASLDMVPKQQYNTIEARNVELEERMRNMVPKQNYEQLQRRNNELGQLVSAYQNQVQQNERLQGQLIQNKGQVAILETEKGNMVRKSLYDEVVRKNAKLQRYLDECKSPTIDPNENATSLANKLLRAKEKLCDRYKACSSNNCLQALQIAGPLCGDVAEQNQAPSEYRLRGR